MKVVDWDRVPRAELGDADVDALFAIHTRVYQGVSRGAFEADLAEKHAVIRLLDDTGVVRGFSTVRVYPAEHEGAPVDVFFSGDTAVEPEAWGSPVLARAWLATALHFRRPGRPLWWLLLAGGFRTYRFMPVFFQRGWPRYDCDTPPAVARLRDRLAGERYGDRYADGVVHLPVGAPLWPELAAAADLRAKVDPHVAWYLATNPGYARGDELVCLLEIAEDNLTDAGRRVLRAVAR